MEENQIKKKSGSKEIVGLISVAITYMVFLVRGMWYFYYYGYFKVFNIDKSFLGVENDMSLYSVVGGIGIAILLFYLNYWIYDLIKKKKGLWIVITFLFESIMLYAIICVLSNMGINDVVECIRITGWQGVKYLGINTLLCIMMINIYGIAFHISFFIVYKKEKLNTGITVDSIVGMLEGKSIQGTKQMLMFVNIAIVFSVALGIAVFFSGVSEANSKKDFRIIEETYLPSDKRVDEKYLFKDEDQMDKQYYIVLYETVDQYVSASLAFDNGVIVKDINRQKIISKENINTYYCYDIEKFFESEEMMQSDKGNFDTEKINQEREEKNNMGEMFVGAFIGALFTGIVTLFIERDKQKKEDEKEESHAASVLLYDLKSIEKYLVVENSSVNLRYTMDWQGMIASCSFLKSQQIQYIYEIYDQTYNYNYYYKLKENKGTKVDKEEIPQYKELKKLLFDSTKGYIDGKKYNLKYEEIQNELKKHILQ